MLEACPLSSSRLPRSPGPLQRVKAGLTRNERPRRRVVASIASRPPRHPNRRQRRRSRKSRSPRRVLNPRYASLLLLLFSSLTRPFLVRVSNLNLLVSPSVLSTSFPARRRSCDSPGTWPTTPPLLNVLKSRLSRRRSGSCSLLRVSLIVPPPIASSRTQRSFLRQVTPLFVSLPY